MSGCETLLVDGWPLEGIIKSASTCTGTSAKTITLMSQTRAGNTSQKRLWEITMSLFTMNTNIPTLHFVQRAAIRPDIVIWDRQKRHIQIVKFKVTVLIDCGLNKAEREKIMKYQDLKHDIKQFCAARSAEIIPVEGATGTMKTKFENYLNSIPDSPKFQEI